MYISASSDVQEIQVAYTVEHEGYKPTQFGLYNDIALLVLQKPFRINTNVIPVCMPASSISLQNQAVKMLGNIHSFSDLHTNVGYDYVYLKYKNI